MHVLFVTSGVPPLEVGEGSESTEFVGRGAGAVEDGLHLVGVDGGGSGSSGGGDGGGSSGAVGPSAGARAWSMRRTSA
ncbi:hypothetical protein RRF56_00205 (plasmid) [Nodosilinea sp. E11]|nr:hypothetical protein RRF56_00205 [Nodosilinea sp. E11]